MTASQDLSMTPQSAVQVSCLRDLPGAKYHVSGQCAVKLLLCYRKISSLPQLQRTELCTLPAIEANPILVYTMTSTSKKMIVSFNSAFMRLQLEQNVQFGSPKQKKKLVYRRNIRRDPPGCEVVHSTWHMRKGWEGWVCLTWRRLKKNPFVLQISGRGRGDRSRYFWQADIERNASSGHLSWKNWVSGLI